MRFNFNLLKSGNLLTRSVAQLSVVAVVAAVSTSAVSSSAFATLDSIAYNATQQSISSATLIDSITVVAGSSGFSAVFSGMNPGDTRTVVVAYSNTGTDSATSLTLSANAGASPNALSTDAVRGLQVSVLSCLTAWTGYAAGTPGAAGTCGSQATVINTSLNALVSTPSNAGVAFTGGPTVAAGGTLYLKFVVSLPAQNEVWANGSLAPTTLIPNTGLTYASNPSATITALTAAVTWVIHATAVVTGATNS